MENNVIQIAPLAFMRGRTLNDAVIILDEAQNTTTHQIKMFLTRLGMNAKMIITGDVTQIDLPPTATSGLVQAMQILKGVKGIGKVEFEKRTLSAINSSNVSSKPTTNSTASMAKAVREPSPRNSKKR